MKTENYTEQKIEESITFGINFRDLWDISVWTRLEIQL